MLTLYGPRDPPKQFEEQPSHPFLDLEFTQTEISVVLTGLLVVVPSNLVSAIWKELRVRKSWPTIKSIMIYKNSNEANPKLF